MELTNPVKWTVGIFIGVLVLLGGLYSAEVFEDKIVVKLSSDVCNDATLRVTKDDFTLKCGRYIAFQADTITEYYKTYGVDEWVKNNRFVGRNKKSIDLTLVDYGTYFDIIRTTRYRKGKQSIEDGILKETYTFTKDKIKITYDYKVKNNALHRISMRIKKQKKAYLDTFDPNGYDSILSNNILSYQGYGNLLIDPTVTLNSPTTATTVYNEGDTIPLNCSFSQTNDTNLRNVTLNWTALDGTWDTNGTVDITGNGSVVFSRTIPHLTTNGTGTFSWNCVVCNTTACSEGAADYVVDARYKPHIPLISTLNTTNLNLLNGSDWGLSSLYPEYSNASNPNDVIINWTWTGMPDNNTAVYFNLSYYGTKNNTRYKDTYFNFSGSPGINDNATRHTYFQVENLPVDSYYVTLHACNSLNTSLCSNYTILNPIDIFDYSIGIASGESNIRFSPQATMTKGAALGQTNDKGIIQVDWLKGESYPDGELNLTLNITYGDKCQTFYAGKNSTSSEAISISNNTISTIWNTVTTDPTYIWLWLTKSSCSTTTTSFDIDVEATLD